MKLSKRNLVLAALVIFFLFGFVLREFPFTQGNIDIEKVPVTTSFDVFENTGHSKWIYDTEQAKYLHPHEMTGLYVINHMNSLFYILTASFTKFTAISVYQTSYIITVLLSLFVILAAYVIVEKYFSQGTALIAAALALFPATKWLFQMYIGFQYDYYAFLAVLAIFFFFVQYVEKEKRTTKDAVIYGSIFGILITMIFLAHYVEFMFLPFFGIAGLWLLWKKRITLKEAGIIAAIIAIISLPFIIYYYPLTLQGHLQGGLSGTFGTAVINKELSKHLDYFPWPRFNTLLNILSIPGIIALFLMWRQKKLTFGQKMLIAFIAFAIFIGTSNYTLDVVAHRSERQLFSSFPLFVIIPALGVYFTATSLMKRFDDRIKTFAIIGISIVIALLTFKSTYADLSALDRNSDSYNNDNKWAAMMFIKDNTPKDSIVFYMNGYDHAFGQFGERPFFSGSLGFGYTRENIEKLCSGQYPQEYRGAWAIRDINPNGYIKKRTGINSFELVQPFEDHPFYTYNHTNAPLKLFDYVVAQYRNTGFDPCIASFLNQSMERGHQIVWYNDEIAVVKVKK